MISLKWNSISFHFINFYFILFPFFFLSCGDNLKNGNSKKSFRDIYAELKDKNSLYPRDKVEAACWHGRFLEACHNETEFFTFINEKIEKKDMPFVSSLRDGMLSFFNKNECSYVPESGVVKEVYQICLIPGFFIRTVDAYTPLIAKHMATCLIEEKPYCAVEATTVPRWGAYVREYNDNTSFYTQCNALDRQITAIIANLQKKYNNPRIHLCFVCESFGGKIGLFFLSKNLKRYQSQKVSIDNFITVHSPLYGMTLAKYMVDKRESMMKLWSNKAFGLLVTAIQYDFLNVLNVDYYWETFKLLSESQIDRVTTDQALGNLIAHRVKILNFIGTPNDIVFSGLKPSYSVIIKILKALTNHFFDVDASGKDVFKTAQWDTFDHSLRSISGIILELKQTGIFNMLVENFAGQRNPLLKTIQQCQDDIQLEVVLRELLSQYDFNEQIFLDTNFVEAIRLLSGLLRDITNLLEKDVYNSDVVVGVEEITKNPVLIKEIENSRTKPFIFGEYPEQVFIVTPNIYHVCDHAAMPEFNQDLRMFFNPLFMRTLA